MTSQEIKLPRFLEHWHIDEWRRVGDRWEPWGDCGMCNGALELKAEPLKPPTIGYEPIRQGGRWYWHNLKKRDGVNG